MAMSTVKDKSTASPTGCMTEVIEWPQVIASVKYTILANGVKSTITQPRIRNHPNKMQICKDK